MNRKSYIRIIEAVINLIVVIMVEAGRVPIENAMKVGENIFKALTGGSGHNKQ